MSAELLTPDLLACIGRKAPEKRELVTRRDIRKYAVATGSRIQKHLRGDVAPPTFYLALFWEVVELEDLAPDGMWVDTLIPRLPLGRAMAGGLDLEYFAPIVPGDELVANRTLTRLYEKQGSQGPLIFYEVTMVVTRNDGSPVLTERSTRIMR